MLDRLRVSVELARPFALGGIEENEVVGVPLNNDVTAAKLGAPLDDAARKLGIVKSEARKGDVHNVAGSSTTAGANGRRARGRR